MDVAKVVAVTSWLSFMVAEWLGVIVHWNYALFGAAWLIMFLLAIGAMTGKRK